MDAKLTSTENIGDYCIYRFLSEHGYTVYVLHANIAMQDEIYIHASLDSASRMALGHVALDEEKYINPNGQLEDIFNAIEKAPSLEWTAFKMYFKKGSFNRKRKVVLQQIAMQEAMQEAGFNVVECGSCGTTLIHQVGAEEVECFCDTMALSDCPDVYYRGMENNQEFNTK